ncbi:MAG: hypothetical protein PF489_14610 [Salinivirgaceae bacterium]|nr:hypothetical protein [Salinivirgaceae bacterium]
MKKIVLICLLCITTSALNAQETLGNITVKTGSSLDVYFYQLSHYASGITLSTQTTLGIYYKETDAGGLVTGNGWQLSIEPDGDIRSLYSNDFIPINVVDISVDGGAPETLTGGKQLIKEGIAQDASIVIPDIVISYSIGKTNPITNVSNERYMVLLNFILEAKP